jgi:predicted nucleic acid-binding protein
LKVYFLESSALAKLFVMEEGSNAIIELVESIAQPQKLLSTLGFVEVHSAIRRREMAGELTPAHADQAIGIMSAEIPLMMEQTINPSVIETSRLMIDRHCLRALDAVQLASCHVARATAGFADVVFVASDKALLAAARNEDFEVWDPEQGLPYPAF